MAVDRVNPPKQLKLPPEVAANPQLKKAFDDRDFVLFQLWKRSGGSENAIDTNLSNLNVNLASQIAEINERLGSGIPVTIDSTGFTTDTTEKTTDITEM